MSKNTGDTKFRTVDVDRLTEPAFQDELTDEAKPSSLNISEINDLISSGRSTDAILCILQNAPINSKDPQVKDTAFKLMMRLLSQFKSNQNIDDFLSTMDQDKIDLLMKYIYRGFEQPQEISCATLLTWHEKVYAYGKVGSIMRVLTDRKRV
ncbi:Actin-related protein 2/3 complex subunit 5-B [Schistosoma japonicum]|uniref:Actin-related protein 2/3 complex subunit 5 n=1 Tax=Schistosoma japonicum TaxID=6182 RepID=Q86DV5_SCHJA|nr:similar to GenBank Accession Number AJ291614 actin related protein 2/3 protein complex subunit p16 in Lumbricus rubellus [Schistosoma japonicum]KAH8855379.1 Actin-related protein 2/3 complex subunit 5-B [Schistosoma japonicum]